MGYTHYWSADTSHPQYAQAWPALISDTTQILELLSGLGIALAGPMGIGAPIIDLTQGIGLNGDEHLGEDYESFQLYPPAPHGRAGFEFCKTEHMPYDLAVTSILLRLVHLAPVAVRINSDGDWKREWTLGTALADGRRNSPRTVVASLFGQVTNDNPLRA